MTRPIPTHKRPAFSLVELLTVIFIISLLIAILIPSLGAARNAAKKASTQQAMRAIDTGMEMFKNEQGGDFAQTNGYPPSFAHPPITDADFGTDEAAQGRFPFLENAPRVYGAHWLPAMLMGVDAQGYIPPRNVPRDRREEPQDWYATETSTDPISERAPLYLDPNNVNTVRTVDLRGRPPENLSGLFPDWDDMNELPVIADAFDQPILYYAANKFGRPTNMVAATRDTQNPYADADAGTGNQAQGPPYYFHQDNVGFTGDRNDTGWDLGNSAGKHPLRDPGEQYTAQDIVESVTLDTFATYIIDRKVYRNLKSQETPPAESPLRPVNPDSYLLISPGVDGVYGTTDDISNLPPRED